MKTLARLIRKKKRNIIGLAAGTCDEGSDLVLLEISGSGRDTKFKVIRTYHQVYTPRQKESILNGLGRNSTTGQVDTCLARIGAAGIQKMLAGSGIDQSAVDLIGSQEIPGLYSFPGSIVSQETVGSINLTGTPSLLARLTGITTIGNFPAADLAAGGRGDPLLPYFDWICFSRFDKNILLLDLDDVNRVTYLPANGDRLSVQSYVSGPGILLIDSLLQRLYEIPSDRDGIKAGYGRLSKKLFSWLQKTETEKPIVSIRPEGKRYLDPDVILPLLRKAIRWRIPEPDVIHTVSRYTVYRIWKTCQDKIPGEVQEVVVAGKRGVNQFVMNSIQEYFSCKPVNRIARYNIDEQYRMAMCSAVLANECFQGVPVNMPAVTGAKKQAVLGVIYPAGTD
jgi:anhydro-N-acetylmuramic acid kinase